jgi:hypothetical protein
VRGKTNAKSIGLFTYDKGLDEDGKIVPCEVMVYPLLVTRQSETWPEKEQRVVQWVSPTKAASLVKEPGLKLVIINFAKHLAKTATRAIM